MLKIIFLTFFLSFSLFADNCQNIIMEYNQIVDSKLSEVKDKACHTLSNAVNLLISLEKNQCDLSENYYNALVQTHQYYTITCLPSLRDKISMKQ